MPLILRKWVTGKYQQDWRLNPLIKKGTKPFLKLADMEFNKPISESFFSQQNMKSIK